MTVAHEGVRWKLALCPGCGKHRMMPEANTSCIACERERRPTLSAEDVRWIVSYRGPEEIVRAAWTLASETANAAVGLDARTGAVTALRWGAGKDMPVEETDDVIILAVCPATRKAELPGLLVAEMSLSVEDTESLAMEVVVRSAMGDGGEKFWQAVEDQLQQMPGMRERS